VQPWLKGFEPPVIFNGQPWTTVTTTAATNGRIASSEEAP